MKQKNADSDQITKADLKNILGDFRDEILDKVDDKMNVLRDQILYAVDDKIDNFRHEIKDEFREYRSENMTKHDQTMAELINAREERAFLNHDIQDHEKRITKLEHS